VAARGLQAEVADGGGSVGVGDEVVAVAAGAGAADAGAPAVTGVDEATERSGRVVLGLDRVALHDRPEQSEDAVAGGGEVGDRVAGRLTDWRDEGVADLDRLAGARVDVDGPQ
jgi:hypothetical protein